MLLPLLLFIFFADYYEESYQQLCENPKTLCLTSNIYVLYPLIFKERQQAKNAQSSLVELWCFQPVILHKGTILSLIIIFSLPEILRKPLGL